MFDDFSVKWLILGFVIGCVISFAIVFGLKIKPIYRMLTNKDRVENTMIVCCILVITLCVLSDLGLKLEGELVVAILSIIGSMAFSYFITKRFSKRDYEAKLKEEASTAYRHNKNLLLKIIYEINLIDTIFSQNICVNKNEKCAHIQTLYRLRDSLIHCKRDAEENINDWSNIIAEEITTINEVVSCRKRKTELLFLRTDTEDGCESEVKRISEELDEVELKLIELEKKLDDKPIYKIILKNEIDAAEEMEDWIQKEKNDLQSKKLKEEQSYAFIKEYIEKRHNMNVK